MSDEFDYPVVGSASELGGGVVSELVTVHSWKQRVNVQELTGEELDAYREGMYVIDKTDLTLSMKNNTLRLLTFALRDANGNRLYPNLERGVAELGKKPSGGLEVLAKVARRLSKLSDDDAKDLEGKSGAGPTSSSKDDSPSPSESLALSS